MKNPKPASLSSELLSRDEETPEEELSRAEELEPDIEVPEPHVPEPHVNGTAGSDVFAHQRERVAQLAAELKGETARERNEAALKAEALAATEEPDEPSLETPPGEAEHTPRVALGDWVERAPRREEKERAALMSRPTHVPKTEAAATPRSVVMLLVITGVAFGTVMGLAFGGAFDRDKPQIADTAGTVTPARGIEVATLPPVTSAPSGAAVAPATPAAPHTGTTTEAAVSTKPMTTVPALSIATLTGYGVQLAAVESEAAAVKVWDGLAARHAALLADHPHEIVQTVVGGRTYFRVRAGEFANLDDARTLCKALKAKAQDCLVFKRS